MKLKVLALDLSTKSGWSSAYSDLDGYVLDSHGTIEKRSEPSYLKYPESYVEWVKLCFGDIKKVIDKQTPDVVIIEETTPGRNSFSQKILEWIHYLVVLELLANKKPIYYLKTGVWRDAVNSRMNKDEAKKNISIRKIKTKTGVKLAKDDNGKVMGKITKKHVSIRRVEELFGLKFKMKDNDTAEAILIGKAWHELRFKEAK